MVGVAGRRRDYSRVAAKEEGWSFITTRYLTPAGKKVDAALRVLGFVPRGPASRIFLVVVVFEGLSLGVRHTIEAATAMSELDDIEYITKNEVRLQNIGINAYAFLSRDSRHSWALDELPSQSPNKYSSPHQGPKPLKLNAAGEAGRESVLGGGKGKAAAMAGGDRERDVEEETRNQMMQNLFGDQSEDEDADDDDVVEVVDEDDQPQPQRLQQEEADDEDDADEEEDDARSHAHGRGSGYHSVSTAPISCPSPRDPDPSRQRAVSVLVAGLRLRFRDSSGLAGILVIVEAMGSGRNLVTLGTDGKLVKSIGVSMHFVVLEEVDGEAENGGEGEGEGEGESEGQVGMEEESEGEAHQADVDQGESDGDKVQSSPERELGDQRMQTDARGTDSEDEGYEQRTVASRRRGVVASESEGSEDNYYGDQAHDDEEVREARKPRSPVEEDEVVRDVFGDSDEDEPGPYQPRHEIDEDSHRSPMEDEGRYDKDMQPEDMVADEDMRYESDENRELKLKEKPVGPPLDLVVPLKQPPAQPDKMNVIKVSNIMGIESKPFDPKTYVEEDSFVTDESGTKKRIRLEDNIVRWRNVKNADGTTSCESNARIVKWKDGSMQLLIGNEVLDISVQEAHHDQSHLFLRTGKGILQSQGRLLQKMRFMPSSLSSKSHRLLTALVDSQNKKTVKMQKWFETKDPEKAKQEHERAAGQNIRAHSILQRKREKVTRKYTQPPRPRRQLSPGFLEDALDEDEEHDNHYSSRRMPPRRHFEDELEAEARAERRIINAKSNMSRSVSRKPSYPPARPPRRQVDEYSESEREESEYETEGEDIEHSPPRGRGDELDEDEYEEDVEEAPLSDEEMEAPKRRRELGGSSHRREELDSEEDDDSPPRKQQAVQHRRKAVVFDSDEDE
ncbi:hypothetical protein EJB05_13742, partial [Eragrostis curvula]